MRRLATLVANIPELIAGTTMLAITAILFAGVIWRYFFLIPLTWSDEIARILFAWLAFVGAAVGVKRRLHSAVLVVGERLPARWQKAMTVLGLVTIGIMGFVLLYTGATETVKNFNQHMAVTGISRGWLYLSVPVSGALILIYLVPQFRDVMRGVPLRAQHEATGTE